MGGLLLAGAYWGYKFISRNARSLIGAPVYIWAIYLFIKVLLSFAVGIFVGPYEMYRMSKQLRACKSLDSILAEEAQQGRRAA